MKVRAKKLAVLMLAGTLVLSGFTKPKVVNAEETGEKVSASEEMTEDTQGKQEKPEENKLTGESAKPQKEQVTGVSDMAVKATTAAKVTMVAKVGDKEYESLKQAFAEAPNNATIKLITNIKEFKTEDIATISSGKTFVLDMAGYSISASADFKGRFIVNEGNLTVTGNGIMDASASKVGGFGAINNKGTLTIQNGTYRGAIYASGSVIRNTGKDASLTVENGTFEGATSAIYNEGTAVLKDGIYKGETCSQCNAQIWSYTIRNATESAKMTIDGGTYTGVQGAVSSSVGYLEINGGTMKSVKCKKNSDHTATFYALYAAGEQGKVKCVINGGHFETEGKVATVLVGNDNDGGIKEEATVIIRGGTFVAPNDVPALKGAEKTGDPQILGGTFTSDISKYLPSGMEQDENGQVIVDENAAAKIGDAAYDTLADAIKAVKDGETIELTRNVTEAEEISVPSGKNFTIDFKGKEYIVTGPGAGSPNTETNAFQFLKDSTITMKNGTIKVGEKASKNRIGRIIQNYADLTLENMIFDTKNLGQNEDYALSFNNGNIVFKGNTSIHTSDEKVIAFDVCKFSSYPSVNVTFDESFTGKIEGKIIYDSTDATTHTLMIKGNGSFAGIDASKGNEKNAEESVKVYGGSFGESVEEYVADELEAELKKASSEYPYSYYATMEEALANAGSGDVVKDLTAPEDAKVFTITLDYGYDNKVVTIQGTSVTLPELQREGYKFLGWFVGDKTYKPGEVAVTEDTKFTAKWEKVQTPEPKPEEKPNQKPTPNQNDKPAANKSDKPVSKVPKTGDTANVAGYMTVMVLAAGMVAVALRKKRRA